MTSRSTQRGTIKDKRRAPRRPSDHLIAYTHLDADKRPDEVGMGKTLDISEKGVKIQTHNHFPVGTNFEMVIAIEKELVEAKGQIVYRCKAGPDFYNMGVSFTEIEEKE